MKSFLFLLASALTTSTAFAQIQFNEVTYRGTGCAQGTVSTVVSPDGSSLSILFDEFRVEVPQYDGNNDNGDATPRGPRYRGPVRDRRSPTINHKNCQLSFTAILPPGTKADALEISMQARGATMFDSGVEGYFASILVGYNGLASSRGRPTVVIQKNWGMRGMAVDENWTAEPRSLVQLQSGCSGASGKSIRFDMKNHINAEIPSGDQTKHGMISVDSSDMTGLLKFRLKTSPCGGRMAP